MKKFLYLLLFVLVSTSFLKSNAQSCPGNILTDVTGYYGGFESGSKNFTTSTGSTDYVYGMPPNGAYEIVNYAANASGGGYLSLAPHSGNYQMISHTRSANKERIWYKNVAVTPGAVYQFCAWIANVKTNPVSGFKINLNINGVELASKTTGYGWSQVCGTYTVPAGVTSVLISITDPDAHTGPSHFLALDDICFTRVNAVKNVLGNLVWNDTNGDGKKNANEPGIGEVTVKLYADVNRDNLPDGAAVATTTTNAQGNYQFTDLADGRYVVGLDIPAGYTTSDLSKASSTPDNDIDNDNNGIRRVNQQLFTNAVTLVAGTEPTADGDGANGNQTLDLALCGNGVLGDFVWNDANANGIQDANEPGLYGVSVTLTYANGTTRTVISDNNGNFYFLNLGPGNYSLSFATPAGYAASPANQGINDATDSDPVNGAVYVTLGINESNLSIDAGFFSASGNLVLGNVIWNDINGNGLKDAGEPGIGGATVKLYRDSDANNVPDGTAIATVVTNNQGVYSFSGLTDGKYIVGVLIPTGYGVSSTAFANTNNDVDNDNNGFYLVSNEIRTAFITLASGTEPVNDGDDANGNLTLDIAMTGKSIVGDFIWKDIDCNGIQNTGEPGISNVIIAITFPDGTIATTTSDAAGKYKFINLGPGVHKISFTTPAGYNLTATKVGTNDAVDSDAAATGNVSITVVASSTNNNVDAGFCTGQLSVGNMVWNDTDGDGKKDPNEPGIGGILVKLYTDTNGDNLPDGSAIATTTTNTQGAYLFTGLADGRYIASISVIAGYSPGGQQPGSNNPDNDTDNDNNAINRVGNELFTNAITLTAGNEPTTDGDNANGNLTLDLALCGNAYIGDFVWNDLNANGIQDADEPGLPGVNVSIVYADGTVKTVQTDVSGIYYFPNLGPGTYTVTFVTPATFTPSPTRVGSDAGKDSDPLNGTVNVTILADVSNLTIDAGFNQAQTLKLGNMVWNDINNNGLRDASETGIANLTVNLYTDSNGDNIPDGAPIYSTVTAASGSYTFTNLTNGRYIAGVVLPGGYTAGVATTGGSTPDNNIDNDNNGVVVAGTEVRSKFITLAAGAEPTYDGDDSNGNLTLDFGLKAMDVGCAGNLLANSGGYFGGFEAGGNNISATTGGSDLYNHLPRNGSYQIVNNISQLGGGGYLDIKPLSGNYFLAAHTSNRESDRVWFSKVTVTPGTTYKFCANVTLLKNLGSGARFVVGVYANGVSIGTGRVSSDWTSICGTYTVPTGVTNIEISIRDPKKGLFFLAIDDICFTPTTSASGAIGDFVFNDINNNGIQNTGEGGIANVPVTLTDVNGATKTTLTNSSGYYQFGNLVPGTYNLEFATPTGFVPSPAKQGTNAAIDSDPVGGIVTVTLGSNQVNNTIDAGFYRSKCSLPQGSCGVGYLTYETAGVKNGNFANPIIAPAPGNTFPNAANTSPGTIYYFNGGQYKSQSDYRGTGYADKISGNQNAHSIITTSSTGYIATFTGQEAVNQLPFPGDLAKGVAASNSFMFWNGNQFSPEPALVWEQTLTGLTVGQTYTFRFYASNLMQPVSGTDNFNDPLLLVKFDGTSGLADGVKVFPAATASTPDYYQLTKAESANATAFSGWVRFEVSFVATSTSRIVKILDCARGTTGDVLGITAIGLETCEKDTDSDCIPDIDDIDDDNDGLLDIVESGGYDPLKDCDNDGIPNYKDASSGCAELVYIDCNGDGINDFFDFDRDGIMNELDLDSDNDGILDVQETRDPNAVDNNNDGMVDGVDLDGDGLLSTADFDDLVFGGPGLTPEDLDRDGKPNYLDLDSDGDGVSDLTEATGIFDTDGLANGTDTDGDGVRGDYTLTSRTADTYNGFGARGVILLDTDGDGYPNLYDIDSDDDGITDNVEAQPTCSYKTPAGNDTDKDGLDDAYDSDNNTCTIKAPGITPFDKDGDTTPDMFDTDTDNDGAPDLNEGSGLSGDFILNRVDTDGDGLIDEFDIFNLEGATGEFWRNGVHSNMGDGGSFDGPLPSGSNASLPQAAPGNCSTNADRDWRNIYLLPVTLVEFKGNLANAKASLTWTVANELNIQQYIVERSTDGRLFTAIGQVAAAGNAISARYAYIDDVSSLSASTVYYRLKIVENNAGSKASSTLAFTLGSRAGASIALFPNPASTAVGVSINAETAGMAMVRMIDMYGKILSAQNTKVAAGLNVIYFNELAKLAAGTYSIQVILNGKIMNEKLVVTK